MLYLVITPELKQFLSQAEVSKEVDSDDFGVATVRWSTIKRAAAVFRDRGETVNLERICAGSKVLLKAPQKRQASPEFQKVLDERKRYLKQMEYESLIRDVAPQETSDSQSPTFLPTTKLQLGQGLHIAVTMGLGYALGSQCGAALSHRNSVYRHIGGVAGIIVALIFETALFIARAGMQTNAGLKYEYLLNPKKAELKAKKPVPKGEAFTTQPGNQKACIESKKAR